MNTLVPFGNSQITMTSREIAELVESRHDDTKRAIERLAERGVIEFPPMAEIPTATKPMRVYVFTGEKGKRDSIVVVAQLSPEFTAKLVDRWQELEAQAGKPALPDFSDPVAAARAWADEREKTQLLEAQVREDAPKVEFYHDVTGSGDTVDMATVAKVLNTKGFGRNNLFAFLRKKGVLNGRNEPYQKYVDFGWFRQIESKFQKPNGDWHISIKTVVFQRGVDGIRKLLKKELEAAA